MSENGVQEASGIVRLDFAVTGCTLVSRIEDARLAAEKELIAGQKAARDIHNAVLRRHIVRILVDCASNRDFEGINQALTHGASFAFKDARRNEAPDAVRDPSFVESCISEAISLSVREGRSDCIRYFAEFPADDAWAREQTIKKEIYSELHYGRMGNIEVLVNSQCYNAAARGNNLGELLGQAIYFNCHLGIIKILATAPNTNLIYKGDQGNTALGKAAYYRNIPAVEFLAGLRGVIRNARDNEGRTSLMHLASVGEKRGVEVLLSYADVRDTIRSADRNGFTAWDLAKQGEHHEVMKVLKAHGAVDPSWTERMGACVVERLRPAFGLIKRVLPESQP